MTALDKSPRKIREMFDQISPRYDFLNHLLSLNTDVMWRRQAASLCAPADSKPVHMLDVCSGTGDLAFELRRKWNCRVTGTDFALRMLEIGSLKAKRGRARDVRFGQADTMRLPFHDDSFDACTVAFGIRNVADTSVALREMTRVIRPGGRVVILEFTLPPGRIVRNGYLFYFNKILPMIGELFTSNRRGAYRYLPSSVMSWPSPEELKGKMEGAGLVQCFYELLAFGVAAIHVGTKNPAKK